MTQLAAEWSPGGDLQIVQEDETRSAFVGRIQMVRPGDTFCLGRQRVVISDVTFEAVKLDRYTDHNFVERDAVPLDRWMILARPLACKPVVFIPVRKGGRN